MVISQIALVTMPPRLLFAAMIAVLAALPVHAQQSQPGLFESLGKLLKPADAPANAAAPPAARNLGVSASTRRVALVIGNDSYQAVPPLEKAANDARAMGKALEQAQFETRVVTNATRTAMNQAINQFADDIAGGGIGVFFFAGHGVQVNNQNYLIPVDLQGIQREADIADQGVSLQGMQDKLAEVRAKFSLLVIDACRDNPLPKKAGRALGGTRGLSSASSAEGQMVVFSAGANQQALDKLSDHDPHPNGVFTREFLPWIGKPGVSIRDAVQGVRSAVRARARDVNHEQFPAIYDQAEGNFYFVEGTQVASLGAQIVGGRSKEQIEDELWDAIKGSEKPGVFEAYLREYPNGRYLAQAKVKLAGLQDATRPVPTAAVVEPPALPLAAPARSDDPEADLWKEVKASGAREYLDAYLKQYPRGKYVALAKVELKKLDGTKRPEKAKDDAERKAALVREEAERKAAAAKEQQEARQAEQDAWDAAKRDNTASAYGAYLERHPKGRYAALAQAVQTKAQREDAEKEKQETARREREAREAEKQRLSAEREAPERGRQEQARRAKEAAEMRPGKVFKDCADCPEMVILPAGSFEMGGYQYDAEKPVHHVTIPKALAIGKTEVTQGQWRAVMDNNPSHFSNCGDACPVEAVSWDDVKTFVQKLSAKTGKTYRLPSEAEWEYACRAGGRHEYCGSDDGDSVAWYGSPITGKTRPVAGKQANAWGLHDLSGNVWEWVEDCWNASYNSAPTDGSGWAGGDCGQRVLRGGSWGFSPQIARSANRIRYGSAVRDDNSGFRLVRMLP